MDSSIAYTRLSAQSPNVLLVHPKVPASTLRELIAFARSNPGKLTYASQGVGSTAQLSSALLEQMADIKMLHVPYRGALPALNDVIAGHVDMFFDTATMRLMSSSASKSNKTR